MPDKTPDMDPAQVQFIIKYGADLADLADNPAWITHETCEEYLLKELQEKTTSIPLNSTNYSERLIFMAGMVEGLRRYKIRRQEVVALYKQKLQEDQNNGNTTQPTGSTTYGHTA